MTRKIFVSYKYQDSDVQSLPTTDYPPTWPCDYVEYTEKHIFKQHIYKGERQGEDLSQKSEPYIWDHLKDKIYDSTITVLLISPNMKEIGKWQRSQWIPWELSYSLRETTRHDRTSHRNAIVAVVLPDKQGSYYYFDKDTTFPILRENIDNGYIYLTEWWFFEQYADYCISEAEKRRIATPSYKISIML